MKYRILMCLILSMALTLAGCRDAGSTNSTMSESSDLLSSDTISKYTESGGENHEGEFSETSDSAEAASRPGSGNSGTTNNQQTVSPITTSGTPTTEKDMATPCIIATKYQTADVVIADVVATNSAYGADSTGAKDSTQAIQKALNDCRATGGGTVWLPAGKYKITSSITIPSFVTLRGDWQDPDAGNEYGTIVLAQINSSDTAGPALFNIGGSAGVMGLTVYYPDQDINNVKPYPFTFYVSGQVPGGYMLQSIVNCTVINGYRGIGACLNKDKGELHEMMTVDTLKGTFLSSGAEAYNQADVGTWKNVTIDNQYWANAGAGLKKADRAKLDTYTRANATGLILGDLEWTQFTNLKISGCKTGIRIVKGKRIEFAGSLFDVTVENCDTGLLVDEIDTRWGMVVSKGRISGSVHSVVNNTGGVVKLAGVTLSGGTVGGNIIQEPASLSSVTLDYSREPIKPKAKLYTVNADKTGKKDVSDVLQQALDSAGKAGGGVVYLPAGKYLLQQAITVPADVELRGASSVAQREQVGLSYGTLLFAEYGENTMPDTSTALITLNGKNAGVRGIRIFYTKNNFLNGVKKYGYAIRGRSAGVYTINVTLTAAYNGVDFRSCDGHIIDKLVGCAYNNMIIAGGVGGYIEGCLQNGTAIYRNGLSLSGWPTTESTIFQQLFDPITRVNTEYLRLSGAENQTVMNIFAYGVKNLLVSENSTGVRVVNIGADNIGGSTPLLRTSGGSLIGVNILRYNGISFTNNGTALKLYNRLTINDKTEPTVQ